MDNVESGIYSKKGEATNFVIFGGKILIAGGTTVISGKEYKGVYLCEGKNNYGVGGRVREGYSEKMSQVQLLFDNEQSIDILIENLQIVKSKFKPNK